MTIAFVKELTQVHATSPASLNGGSFTPGTTGNQVLAFGQNEFGNSLPITFGGGSTYSALNAPSAATVNDTNSDTHGIGYTLSLVAGSQALTISGNAGNSMEGQAYEYSGVSAIGSGDSAVRTSPGTGAGAITGQAVTVPTGSVLVAICKCVSALTVNAISVAGGGTSRGSSNNGSTPSYVVGEWAGSGGSITPSFTDATNGGGNNYIVLQAVLTGGGGTLIAAQGSYALTGQAAQLSENLGPNTGGLVIGSAAAWVGAGYVGASDASAGGGGSPYSMPAAQGSYALNGQAAALRNARRITAAQGSYTLNGQTVGLRLGKNMVAAQGSYALTGQALALTRGRRLVAAQGSYAITGADALVDVVISAGAGSYTLTGQTVGLSYSGGGARSIPAGQGSYSLSGQAAALRVGRALIADAGAYALTGIAAGLKQGRSLTAALGTYALTGIAATLQGPGPKTLTALPGAYALTGRDVTLTYSGAPAVLDGGEWHIRARRRSVR